ncbi:MAG: hypothetical protein ABFS39_20040 [Pseudomonadota bacterium]
MTRRNTIVFPGRHYKPDSISLGITFAFIGVYGVAVGIMGIVWVALVLLLIDPNWPLLKQGLVVLGLINSLHSMALNATPHKIQDCVK